MGSHAGKTMGSIWKTSKISFGTLLLSMTTSNKNSLHQSLVITKYPFSPRSSPHEFSTRNFVGLPSSWKWNCLVIFQSPFRRIFHYINRSCRKNHSMSHCRFSIKQTVGLRQRNLNIRVKHQSEIMAAKEDASEDQWNMYTCKRLTCPSPQCPACQRNACSPRSQTRRVRCLSSF